jgi:hypothetical protein
MDAKNPAGLGPPAFDRVEDAAAEVHTVGGRAVLCRDHASSRAVVPAAALFSHRCERWPRVHCPP